jgi:hypothetical protein
VYTIYPISEDPTKTRFAAANDGVCQVLLVDNAVAGDDLIDKLTVVVDSDSDNEIE